jgi:hypothetical protein
VRGTVGARATFVDGSLGQAKSRHAFALAGIDTDNDSVFINDTLKAYCEANRIEFTRCRPYRKNDQAYVEQKNGQGRR